MFRGIKEVQEMPLFPWLKGLYEFWKYLTDEIVYYGAMVGFSELLRTGCTIYSRSSLRILKTRKKKFN